MFSRSAPGAPPRRPSRLRLALTAGAATVLTAGVALTALAAPSAAAADCSGGYVGLTYDDGPIAGNTTNLLNALRSANARATFFNIGQRAQQNAALVRAERDAGMWIGNHSWTHPHLTQLSASQINSELSQTQQAIQQAVGTAPRLFRPPYGETNATVKSVEQQLGLTEIIWDVDSQDWNGASTAQIVAAANNLRSGGVILMHDGYQTTVNAVPQIVANLAARNLCPGMISPSTGRAVAPDGGNPPPTTAPPTTAPPPTTPPPTTAPPTTPPPGGGTGCSASVSVNQWTGGFTASIRVTAGSASIGGWTVTVTLPSGAGVANAWNANASGNSGTVRFTNVNYNGSLGAGQSTEFGFQGTGTAGTLNPTCTAS
ncbi:polysaccharide deacetylase family protein [Micromonospora zhanjiangensis]|uniref:Polysaccharide deacetylase family protein n=1 Tax=Micromonospora zhanjiangensis TaxID=1522057 RepID=A0ABV8KJU7_9ACTN